MTSRETTDRHGSAVCVGANVRIVELPPTFLASLPEGEREYVEGMAGETFEVSEIDRYGSAWVEKVWSEKGGTSGERWKS